MALFEKSIVNSRTRSALIAERKENMKVAQNSSYQNYKTDNDEFKAYLIKNVSKIPKELPTFTPKPIKEFFLKKILLTDCFEFPRIR